jgi:hypothetical protein
MLFGKFDLQGFATTGVPVWASLVGKWVFAAMSNTLLKNIFGNIVA